MTPDDYTSVVLDSSILAPPSKLEQIDRKKQQLLQSKSLKGDLTDTSSAFEPHDNKDPMAVDFASANGDISQSGQSLHLSGAHDHSFDQSQKSLDRYPLLTNEVPNKTDSRKSLTVNGVKNEKDDDEVDIINNVMRPGMSAEPLVTSIRQELERLAHKNNTSAPGINFSVK